MAATHTHIKLKEHIEKKYDINVCFHFHVYDLDLNEQLINIYNPDKIVKYPSLTGQNKQRLSVLKTVSDDDIFILRVDLHLKDYFIELFDPRWKQIMIPYMHMNIKDKSMTPSPHFTDFMYFVPRHLIQSLSDIHVELIEKKFPNGHPLYWKYIERYSIDDIHWMIPNIFSGCPNRGWNPFFFLCGSFGSRDVYEGFFDRLYKYTDMTKITYCKYTQKYVTLEENEKIDFETLIKNEKVYV